jgi:hypothetical protein
MIDDLDIPTAAEAEYLAEFGCIAICIACSPSRLPCVVLVTDDLAATLDRIRAEWHWSIGLATVLWCADTDVAGKLVTAIAAPLDTNGRLDTDADDAERQVRRAATLAGVPLTAHAAALARVRAALARVDGLIAEANVGGDLSWFNAAYRRYRLATGEDAMPYGHALRELRRAVVRRLVGAGDAPALDTALLRDVFPPASRKIPAAGARNRPAPSRIALARKNE